MLALLSAIYIMAMTAVWRFRGTGFASRNARVVAVGLIMCAPLLTILSWPVWLACVVLTALCDIPGHGDWIDHGNNPRTDKSEWANRFFHWLIPHRDGPLHDSIGMFFSGSLNLLPIAAICAFFVSPLALLAMPAGGAAKSFAYYVAWRLEHKLPSIPMLRENTEWAEASRGPLYAAIVIAMCVYFGGLSSTFLV